MITAEEHKPFNQTTHDRFDSQAKRAIMRLLRSWYPNIQFTTNKYIIDIDFIVPSLNITGRIEAEVKTDWDYEGPYRGKPYDRTIRISERKRKKEYLRAGCYFAILNLRRTWCFIIEGHELAQCPIQYDWVMWDTDGNKHREKFFHIDCDKIIARNGRAWFKIIPLEELDG